MVKNAYMPHRYFLLLVFQEELCLGKKIQGPFALGCLGAAFLTSALRGRVGSQLQTCMEPLTPFVPSLCYR